MMPWRGRRRGRRWISISPTSISFGPLGRPPSGKVFIFLSELEALRLVDLENLTQEEAAQRMGISRKTLWTDLQRGRAKIVNAIINGYIIEIIMDQPKEE
ncbi:MAG: DUF134 domain-containing protein [Thermoplasmata archaeon]|jgi:predicted DNA-binding protein (UPF0251 family)|nr:DUF134 domain-containing protein [Thermoplasmata archaeon]MVT13119.1 DUF134 domain-containing protein [Euryarchaeota archaeon]MVT14049.1 DUF134 domain-containing protein [Euryarchaeota archaeon]MVT35791.1 DUF134 domain-containing protein [Euryarchaeota archaeon]